MIFNIILADGTVEKIKARSFNISDYGVLRLGEPMGNINKVTHAFSPHHWKEIQVEYKDKENQDE